MKLGTILMLMMMVSVCCSADHHRKVLMMDTVKTIEGEGSGSDKSINGVNNHHSIPRQNYNTRTPGGTGTGNNDDDGTG
ncbi:hypothetical protein ACHQM5_018395 [Ranunculus cassubicifolius]